MNFRDLTKDEIETRIGSINDKGLTLLLYKDARCDMSILDETVGGECWQREHYEVKGNLYCRVGIRTEDTWVWKSDCGTESYTEKEKGESSDSFKRACVNWGIGRELYTSPYIYISIRDKDGRPNYNACQKNGKAITYDKFSIEKIIIENKRITALALRNASLNKRVFVWQATTGGKDD